MNFWLETGGPWMQKRPIKMKKALTFAGHSSTNYKKLMPSTYSVVNAVNVFSRFSSSCLWNLKPYFVVWFRISWQISCANWGLSEVRFLKYSSLIILGLIDWFPNLVILLLIHVKFSPDIDGLTWYMTESVVTKTIIIVVTDQKKFFFI